MALLLILSGVGLLALPGLTRRLGRRLAPPEWARLCALALLGGTMTLELGLFLQAIPTVLRAAGIRGLATACERMLAPLIPGGAPVGWSSAIAALALLVLVIVGAITARHSHLGTWVESCVGTHGRFGPHELVVLPTEQLVAVSVRGPTNQIIVSRGLVTFLAPEQLRAVLHHEAAHLEHGHQRLLFLATALERSVGFIWPIRVSTAVLRTAVERWADEAAAGERSERRAALRSALQGMTTAMLDPAIAAFSPADTVIERLNALSTNSRAPSSFSRALLYAPGVLLVFAIVVGLGGWLGQAHTVVAMAGRCRA